MNAPLPLQPPLGAGFAGARPASLEEVLESPPGAVFFGVDRDLGRKFGAKAAGAARFIRRSSARMAPWSRSELARPTYDIGIVEGSDRDLIRTLFDLGAGLTERGHLPIAVGCDHTVSYWLVASLLRIQRPIVYLYFDAHLDLGLHDDAEPEPTLNNGNFVRFLLRLPGTRCVNVGARAWSTYGACYDAVRGLRVIREGADTWSELEREIRGESVYVSLDVDVLDPSYVPNTGSVEPFGLMPTRVLELFARLAGSCRIVGADVSELQPVDGQGHTAEVAMRCVSALVGRRQT